MTYRSCKNISLSTFAEVRFAMLATPLLNVFHSY